MSHLWRAPAIVALCAADLYTIGTFTGLRSPDSFSVGFWVKVLLNVWVLVVYWPLVTKKLQVCHDLYVGTPFRLQQNDSDENEEFQPNEVQPFNKIISQDLKKGEGMIREVLKTMGTEKAKIPDLSVLGEVIYLQGVLNRSIKKVLGSSQEAPEIELDSEPVVSRSISETYCREVLKEVRSYKTKNIIYCEDCKQMRPSRAHHCTREGRCLPMMDHYCPSLGITVYLANRRYFCQFLLWTTISLLYSLVFTIPGTVGEFHKYNTPKFLVGFVLDIVLALFVGMLLTSQVFLLWQKQTTIEESIEDPELTTWVSEQGQKQDLAYSTQRFGNRSSSTLMSRTLIGLLWQFSLSPHSGWNDVFLPTDLLNSFTRQRDQAR